KKEGYYSYWEGLAGMRSPQISGQGDDSSLKETELDFVRRNLTIHAIYSPWNTSLSSEAKEGERSYALIGADFYPGSSLYAERVEAPASGNPDALYGLAYRVDYQEKNDWDSLELRVLAPQDERADSLAVLEEDGSFRLLETERVQNYLKTFVPEPEGTVYILASKNGKLRYVLIGVGALLLLAAVFWMFRKKGKTPPGASEGAQA
ncbi:MAG: hypothetical protein IJU50_06205, partial [Lachnospiraceae bacterium]|nr:hypothetical protein [Lachnospiraceae bacterium]